MHEFAIATNVVHIATEHAHNAGADKVSSITLRIGALTCVNKQSIEFCFEIISRGTLLEGAELTIIEVPLAVFCASCNKEVELPGLQCLRCPLCDTPSAEVRQGQELEVESMEIIAPSASVQ